MMLEAAMGLSSRLSLKMRSYSALGSCRAPSRPSGCASGYATAFVAATPEAQPLALQLTLVATGTVLTETLAPGATFYLPDLFAELRRRGLPGAPAAGEAMVSPVYIKRNIGVGRIYAGIRVSSAPAAGVSYGVFEPAMPQDPLFAFSAVVPDLRQDSRDANKSRHPEPLPVTDLVSPRDHGRRDGRTRGLDGRPASCERAAAAQCGAQRHGSGHETRLGPRNADSTIRAAHAIRRIRRCERRG